MFSRVLAAVIAQARLAHQRGVASTADIDTAMKYGVNYPHGPFEWSARIGETACDELLQGLEEARGHA